MEEADGHDGLWAVNAGGAHCQAAPDDHHEREPDARFDVVEGQVGWNLSDNVAGCVVSRCQGAVMGAVQWLALDLPNCEACVDFVKLIPHEA